MDGPLAKNKFFFWLTLKDATIILPPSTRSKAPRNGAAALQR